MKQKWNILTDGRGMDEDEIIDAVLKARGIDNADSFFELSEDDMIDFDKLHFIHTAYGEIMTGIQNKYRFVIHADVDADGSTSAAIMYRYLKHYTDDITITINKGKKHGINDDYDYSVIKDKTVFIIVDSINQNYDKLYEYIYKNEYDVKVVIFDHHIIPDNFDLRPTLVSSAYKYSNSQLSGAGVCLKFCLYMDFIELTDYADELFDLAAVGLVADMVDMRIPENRYIVKRGLEDLNNPGIKAILGDYSFDSTAISYSIAPLVNAACRTNQNELSVMLFTEDNVDYVYQIVERLRECKVAQDNAVKKIIPELIKQYEGQENNKVATFFIDKKITAETTGLIGNKMLEYCMKPVLILHEDDGIYTGSARGIGIESFIDYVKKQKVEFADGHENAFGLGVKKENLEDVKHSLEEALSDVEFVNERTIDIQLDSCQIDKSLIDKFKYYSKITGSEYKPITVCVKDIKNAISKPLSGGKHMRMTRDGINYIKWNSTDDLTGKTFDACGTLDSAYWGRSWQNNLIVDAINVKEDS